MLRLGAIICLWVLCACGKGGDTPSALLQGPCTSSMDPFCVPGPVGSLPGGADTRLAAPEVGAGAFAGYFALSDRDPGGVRRPGRAQVSSGRLDIWSDADGVMKMVHPGGVSYLFEEAEVVTRLNDTVYRYAEAAGGSNSMVIIRADEGLRYGYYLLGPVGQVSSRRGSFYFGWETPPSALPGGQATYASATGSQLFTSDGRRIFGRPVTLLADFDAGVLSGELFNNETVAHPVADYDLLARVSVQDVPIEAGRIRADSGMSVSIRDSQDPITVTTPLSNVAIEGSFIGPSGAAVVGAFSASMEITQSAAGPSSFGISGVFSAQRQE